MVVLNDIGIINYLKPLNLLKEGEFMVSYLFLGDYYLNSIEKQNIEQLEKEKKIELFDTDLGFCNLINKYFISPPEASSIYYAQSKNLPLVTQNKIIIDICKEKNIIIYEPCEALKMLDKSLDKIEFVERILNSSLEKR